jgi:O-antigen/teichoic acid export membrane protein
MITRQIIDKSRTAVQYTLVFKTISQFVGGIAAIFLVRALSETEYGIYHLLYSIISLLGMVSSMGISNTIQRYIPEYYSKGEYYLANTLYRTASFLRLISNILLLALALIFWETVSPILKLSSYKTYFMLFTLIIFLDMQRSMLDTFLSSFFLHKFAKPIGCLFPLIRAGGYSLVIIFGKNIWYAILTDLAAYIVVFVALQMLYYRKIPKSGGRHDTFPPAEKKRIIRYAMFYNFNEAGDGLFNSYFDNFIIVMFMNHAAVGAYSFCVTITVIIGRMLPLRYFMEVLRPAFFSTHAKDRENDSSHFFQHTIKIHSIFSFPCFCFLLIYGQDLIIVFFQGKFIDYVPVLCTIFFFFEVLTFPVGLIAQLKEKADIILYSKIFAVYNLIADIVLINYFGLLGAAFATGTAVLGKNCFIWWFIRENASFRGMGTFYLKIAGFWSAITILLYATCQLIPHPLAKLFVGVFGFTTAFFLQFQCRYFNEMEKNLWLLFVERKPKILFILKHLQMLPPEKTAPGSIQ